ncbi:MAG: hypothetical protein ACXWLN_30940 [Thermoanaerobaculia bacterium]
MLLVLQLAHRYHERVPRKVQITSSRADGTREDMPATFEDEEVARLEGYLASVDALQELKIVQKGIPASFELCVRDGEVTYINSEVPPPEEIAALLHRLRPLILENEPMNYLKTSNLLKRRFAYPNFRSLLDEQRELFDSRNNQSIVRITANDTVINCEQTVFDWLNSYEYHRDQKKREKIDSLHPLIPLEHSMPTFMSLLGDKVDAIRYLAALIAVMLGLQESVDVVRRQSPTVPPD